MCIWEWVDVSSALAILGLIYGVGRQVFKWLWPNRDKWVGVLLNSPVPLKGNKTTDWRTDRPQQIGDSFVLDIRKSSGKGRVIDRIWFMKGSYSAAAHPKRWAVTLQGENTILPNWNRQEQRDLEFGHNILINLQNPAKITFIAVEILEPRLGEHWAVGDIRIREIRLFGKFWKVNIG